MPKEAVVYGKIGDIAGAKAVLEAYYCELTVDPAEVAANVGAEQTFTIAGLAIGDMVFVNPGIACPANLVIGSARVSAANTLAVSFTNNFAATTAVDMTTSTWKVLVVRPKA